MSEGENVFCLLTPAGSAAIATLAVRVPAAWPIIRPLFQPLGAGERLPEHPRAGQFWPGRLGDKAGDVIVLAVKQIEPVPWLEIHCHSGPAVIRMLQDIFVSRSFRLSTWQELDSTVGAPDWQIRAKEMLVQAPTTRTAAILLDQYHGAFGKELTEIILGLAQQDAGAIQRLEQLANRCGIGRHLVAPFRVGIGGAPNVGKSSLVNALAGYSRAIVSPVPGTTRDVVSVQLAIDGWPVELFDTAGLRDSAEHLEQQGMSLGVSALDHADLVIWLLDGAAMPVRSATMWPKMLTIINKIDLPPAWEWNAEQACRVSAQTRAGLAELCERIATLLVPHPPEAGYAVPFTPQMCERVAEAHRMVQGGDWNGAATTLPGLV